MKYRNSRLQSIDTIMLTDLDLNTGDVETLDDVVFLQSFTEEKTTLLDLCPENIMATIQYDLPASISDYVVRMHCTCVIKYPRKFNT